MLVLGDEEHKGQLGQSLLQRLHELYYKELPFDNPYTGKLVHVSILCSFVKHIRQLSTHTCIC